MRVACLAALLLGCSGGSFNVAGGGADASVDSSASDTGTAPEDTATDTSEPDVGGPDSAPIDGGAADTFDAAPVCPLAPSTKKWDVSTLSDCDIIRTKYIEAVAASKPCTCDEDCSQKIDPNLCGCSTYVSPANDAYPFAVALAARYEKRSCTTACPAIPCKPITTAKCVATVMGKQCQDL